tara:strand:+ start:150 stop:353 length:204 start_codon:yes stop_codon:yes gene_type:complete
VGRNNTDPVVVVLLFVSVIVRVVVALICIILQVEMSLGVKISVELHVGESILTLWVIVEWNRSEWVE